MKVIDINGNIITDYDLSTGRLIPSHIIREDAQPIDNIKKFAWDMEDFEEVQMYIPNREKSAEEQIDELKHELSKSDYKIIKCSECQLMGLDMPYDIIALHVERQEIRNKINELEQESL